MQAVNTLAVAVLLIALALTVWLTIALFCWRLLDNAATRGALTVLHHALVAMPLVWLVATASLVLRAYLRIGEWPHGSEMGSAFDWYDANIDARSFGGHFELIRLLGIAIVASWAVLMPALHVALRAKRVPIGKRWSLLAMASTVVALCILLNADPAGVMEWLDG
jgi:hypothetical protein